MDYTFTVGGQPRFGEEEEAIGNAHLSVSNELTFQTEQIQIDPAIHWLGAAMAGVDLVTLAVMLGHSRIQMVLHTQQKSINSKEATIRSSLKARGFNSDLGVTLVPKD